MAIAEHFLMAAPAYVIFYAKENKSEKLHPTPSFCGTSSCRSVLGRMAACELSIQQQQKD